MAYDENNIFAKILRGDLPCHKVYEDEHSLAFMDIMPQAPGHTLVIPREQAKDLFELSVEGAGALLNATRKVAAGVKQAMQADGIVLMQLNGAAAGQTVDHIHFHVIPGSIHDLRTHASVDSDPEHLKVLAQKISDAIQSQAG